MGQAYITDLAEEPTDAGPWDYLLDGLDLDPAAIIARWDVDTIDQAAYSSWPYLGAWRAASTDHTLTGSAAAISTETGHKRARFDAVDDYVALVLAGAGVCTVGVLARRAQSDVGGVPISVGPAYVNYNSNGSLSIVGGPTAQYPSFTRPTTSWHWLWISFDGTNRHVAINGEAASVQASTQTVVSKIELGRTIEGGSYGTGPMYIAGAIALNTPISQSQRAAAWAAFAASRPEWAA